MFSRKVLFNSLTVIALMFLAISCTTFKNNESSGKNIEVDIGSKELDDFFNYPDRKVRIAILPFSSDLLDKDETEAIKLHLEEKISTNENFIIIETTEINKVIKSQKESLSGLYDDKYAIKLGKLLFANNVLLIKIGMISDRYFLNLKIVDVENGKIEKVKNLHANTIEDLLYIISPSLLKLTDSESKEKNNKKSLAEVKTINIDSNEFGIDVVSKTIIIDGYSNDWQGIDPIELSKFDNNTFYKAFYIAQDEQNVYLRLDVFNKNLFLKNGYSFFFNIAPQMDYFKGEINVGIHIENKSWRGQLHQNIGDPEKGTSKWISGNFPRGYISVNNIMELKIDKRWLPNTNFMFIRAILANDIDDKHSDLYWSERIQFNL